MPKKLGPGAPLALTPLKAGIILASIAQGTRPRPAFQGAGITGGTFDNYESIYKKYGYTEEDNRAEYLEKFPQTAYIAAYFALQDEAAAAAELLYAEARARVLKGGSTTTVVTRTKTKKRQALYKGQIIDLIDSESTTVEIERPQTPKFVKREVLW
jgi:hypothetical protein